jgi:DNA invertase Pin-like site-specific DNA recombinase
MKKAVLYLRVSTDEERQHITNQREPLLKLSSALGYNIIRENSNRPQFQQMLNDAKNKEFEVIFIWALDRFSREGILNTLSYLKTLKQNAIALKSLQESWLDTRDEGMGELLIAIFSWVAKQERIKISERIKAGLKGKEGVGKRGKDKKQRGSSGYYLRWMRERQKKDEEKGVYKPIEDYEKEEKQIPPKLIN